MLHIALGASVLGTCILDSSYSFFEGGGPWLVGDDKLGWSGSGAAAVLWVPPPPNWGDKQNNVGLKRCQFKRTNKSKKSKNLLCSLLSVSCNLVFNPLPDEKKKTTRPLTYPLISCQTSLAYIADKLPCQFVLHLLSPAQLCDLLHLIVLHLLTDLLQLLPLFSPWFLPLQLFVMLPLSSLCLLHSHQFLQPDKIRKSLQWVVLKNK